MKTADEFLLDIDDDIKAKCAQIKRKQKEKRLNMIFLFACCFIFVMPVVVVIFGASLINVFWVFLITGMLILAIFAITKMLGDAKYEQAVKCKL